MKTVVITGSAQGFGFEMAKVFRHNNLNVVISDLNIDKLEIAREKLLGVSSSANVGVCVCDVTKSDDILNLIEYTKKEFGSIDIWINNAGVNQPEKAIWELNEEEIDMLLDVDLLFLYFSGKRFGTYHSHKFGCLSLLETRQEQSFSFV